MHVCTYNAAVNGNQIILSLQRTAVTVDSQQLKGLHKSNSWWLIPKQVIYATLGLRVLSSGNDTVIALMNWHAWWLPALDLYRARTVNRPSQIGEGFKGPHPSLENSSLLEDPQGRRVIITDMYPLVILRLPLGSPILMVTQTALVKPSESYIGQTKKAWMKKETYRDVGRLTEVAGDRGMWGYNKQNVLNLLKNCQKPKI